MLPIVQEDHSSELRRPTTEKNIPPDWQVYWDQCRHVEVPERWTEMISWLRNMTLCVEMAPSVFTKQESRMDLVCS